MDKRYQETKEPLPFVSVGPTNVHMHPHILLPVKVSHRPVLLDPFLRPGGRSGCTQTRKDPRFVTQTVGTRRS